MLKHGILGLLNYHDLTGYEIMVTFRDSLGFFWSAQTSQIYRELGTLETAGWAVKTAVAQQGKPDKNVYAISPEGQRELVRWLAEEQPLFQNRVPLLMKTFFMGELSPSQCAAFFQGIIVHCRGMLQALENAPSIIQSYADLLGRPDKAVFWEMTLDYGRRNAEATLAWAEDCLKKLPPDA